MYIVYAHNEQGALDSLQGEYSSIAKATAAARAYWSAGWTIKIENVNTHQIVKTFKTK